jgi:hypothetical protein
MHYQPIRSSLGAVFTQWQQKIAARIEAGSMSSNDHVIRISWK